MTHTTFTKKYGTDPVWCADFVIKGTESADLIEAFETVEADAEYQACVLAEFGKSYDEVFADLTASLREEA